MTNPYFPLLIMFAASLVLALGGIGASAVLGPSKKSILPVSTLKRAVSQCVTTW